MSTDPPTDIHFT